MLPLPVVANSLAVGWAGQRQDGTQGLRKAQRWKIAPHLCWGKRQQGCFGARARLMLQASACFASLVLALNRGTRLVKASVFIDFLKEKMVYCHFA